MYAPGDIFHISFFTRDITQSPPVLADATGTPTGILRNNGTDDGTVTITITKNTNTGDYTASGAIPNTYANWDDVELILAATVAGVSDKTSVSLGQLATLATSAQANTINTNLSNGTVTLAPTALDGIPVTDPGVPANHTSIPKMIVALWRDIYAKASMTSSLKTWFKDDNSTSNATAALSDDGTTQTRGKAS